MASEQVQSWIQNDLRLSKLITSFESDFANGYLFGEILVQNNMINDLNAFSKKSTKEAKVKNFQLVEEALRHLKVKFDAKLVNQIMNEERGASLRLLYQMKLGLSKALSPDKNTMTNLKTSTLDKKQAQTASLQQTLPRLGGFKTANTSAKLHVVENKMLKFEHTKKNLQDKAWEDQQKEEELIRSLQQDIRQTSLKKMDENRQFMKDWEKEGKKNWKANQQKMNDLKVRQKYFEDKEVEAYKAKLNRELDYATKDLIGGIDEFEKNLQKLGIEKNTNIEEAKKKMEEKKGVPPGQIQNFSFAATMNKIKEKKNMSDFASKERDRRRRKLLVDQAKTQAMLDSKKLEQQMIEKYLLRENHEQQVAYLELRNQKCKELVTNNRRIKANLYDEKRQRENQELEIKRNQEHERTKDAHKAEILQKKKQASKLRREEKLKKRKLNIEMCSEIIDLVLDIADEAYDKMSIRKTKRLDKPEWRYWMEIFVDNRLVSEVTNVRPESPIVTNKDGDLDSETLSKLNNAKSLEELLYQMRYDEAFGDLLSYLSVVGPFNLSSGQIPEWNDIRDLFKLVGMSELNINFELLFSGKLIPCENIFFGRTLQELYQMIQNNSPFDLSLQTDQLFSIDEVPNYLPLKLSILGKNYAGKRTVAKQIVDTYGGQNKIKIFKMEDMVKEVLEYIAPKPVIEAAPASKKAPAKGGAKVDETPADLYAAFDTTKYKQIGHLIKQELDKHSVDVQGLLQTSNGVQELLSLINNDALLVQLFIAKLKFAFPLEKSESIRNDETRKSIAKENELQTQLLELEQQMGQQTDLKGAKDTKKSAPPKGKPGVSNEDQIKQEIEELTKQPVEGWVLLDFPKTLDQAKIMEQHFTGYISMVDQQKPLKQEKFEQWSKLIAPPMITNEDYTGKVEVQQSAFDGIIVLEADSAECQRRASGRKIDPTTGTIYHVEDNPPPENDIKLRDRLQEYTEPDADPSKMSLNHANFSENEPNLKKWCSSFGLSSQTQQTDLSLASLTVPLLMDITIEKNEKRDAVFSKVNMQIKKILAFKQNQLDKRRQEVRNLIILEEIEKQEQIKQELDKQKIQEEEEQKAKEQQESQKSLEQNESNELQQHDLEVNQNQEYNTAKEDTKTQKEPSNEKVENIKENRLSEEQKRSIWEEFQQYYYKDQIKIFKLIRKQREQIFEGLNETQRGYIDFLMRPDNKQRKINDFIESFNKFSDEFPDLRKDQQTQSELLNRVDNLSNELWAIIEQRKDEAISERAHMIKNGWVKHEMKQLINYASILIQNEADKLLVVYHITAQEEYKNGIKLEDACKKLIDQGTHTYEENNGNTTFPLLNELVIRAIKWLNQMKVPFNLTSTQDVQSLEKEQEHFLYRVNQINTWILLKLRELSKYSSEVFVTLDDWITIAVSKENEVSSAVVKAIRQQVLGNAMKLDFSVGMLTIPNLHDDISIKDYQQEKQANKVDEEPNESKALYVSNNFTTKALQQLYKEFRFNAFEEYLDAQTFINLLVLACQQDGKLPIAWRDFNFQSFFALCQQFKLEPLGGNAEDSPLFGRKPQAQQDSAVTTNQRQFIDWKKLFIHLLLLQSPLPDSSTIAAYKEDLKQGASDQDEINCDSFINTNAWFDSVESLLDEQDTQGNEDSDLENEEESKQANGGNVGDRATEIKKLIFETYKTSTQVLKITDFIHTLWDISCYDYGKTFAQLLFQE